MILFGLCRREINKRVGRIKRLFAWAVENELIVPLWITVSKRRRASESVVRNADFRRTSQSASPRLLLEPRR
jgi:hypothetical protein